MMKYCLILLFTFTAVTLAAQPEKGEIRSGNRAYSKGNLERAEIDYRRALEQNPGSVHAIYNLGNVLYKRQNAAEAEKLVSVLKDSLASDFLAPKVFHNLGNYTLDQKKYSEAVEYYKSSLRLNPDDDETRSNLAYAQKMLKNEQDKQDKDKKDNKDNKDNKDDKQNQDNKDPDQDNKDQDKKDQPQPPPSITPQAAQQMLQAIQNKEKETQEKVNKEKAKVLQGKQKEKNW